MLIWIDGIAAYRLMIRNVDCRRALNRRNQANALWNGAVIYRNYHGKAVSSIRLNAIWIERKNSKAVKFERTSIIDEIILVLVSSKEILN